MRVSRASSCWPLHQLRQLAISANAPRSPPRAAPRKIAEPPTAFDYINRGEGVVPGVHLGCLRQTPPSQPEDESAFDACHDSALPVASARNRSQSRHACTCARDCQSVASRVTASHVLIVHAQRQHLAGLRLQRLQVGDVPVDLRRVLDRRVDVIGPAVANR